MKRINTLLLLLLTCIPAMAQQNRVVIRFRDVETDSPLKKVTIYSKDGSVIAGSDSMGYATVPFSSLASGSYLFALCNGYKPDTLYNLSSTVRMHPLSAMLTTATVNANKVRKLLRSAREYVVDYECLGNTILVATYSGNNGHNAMLYLLNKDGIILSSCKVQHEPLSLYRSCVGQYYCVCRTQFFPITIDADKVSLRTPYPIELLPGMQQCEQSVNGNLYYKIEDKFNFHTVYGMIVKGDSTFKPFAQFEEKEVARASQEEYAEIMDLLEHYQFSEAARKALLRKKWDKGSFAHISLPVYCNGDTLIVFDYFKRQICYFSSSGEPIGTCAIHFDWWSSQQFEILKDDATGNFYIHRYGNKSRQTIEVLNIHTGTSEEKVLIENEFAEQVKIYNGNIYFLWQDARANATRQLFVQSLLR